MRINKNIIVVFLFLVSIIHSSCRKSDWFDIKSDKSVTILSTIQDFEYLLDNFFIMNQNTVGLSEVGSDGHYMPESAWIGTLLPAERNAYTWTNNFPYLLVVDWNKSYEKIFRCNLVLEGLEKISAMNPQEQEMYNRVKGNALFHRSKYYYDLAQIFGQPYKAVSADTDLGIPLKDGIDVTVKSSRATVQQTYDRITTDLILAIDLLPALAALPTKGSKANAFALLARTFQTMEQYDKAGIYADSSLKIYNKLIDYNQTLSTALNMGRFNEETIFYTQKTTDWASIWLAGKVFVEPSLYAQYDSNDLRKTRFFSVKNDEITFKGNYNNSAVGFNGLTTDELYLIKAESFARAGNAFEAMRVLNDLLKTRWNNKVAYPIQTASNAEDALIKVLLERRKELLFRNLRWTDLRRLNLDSRFKITLKRTVGGVTYVLEPDSYKYTLPIPDDVIGLSGMQQNPGWVR